MTLIERGFREKIVLVGVITPDIDPDAVEQSLDELALLVDTAGADVVGRVTQRMPAPDPATYVGRGKADEIRDLSYAVDSDTVVFDDELSPAQQRNLEKIFGRTAIDRTAVILDIFAQNARTQEGKAQVELALLQYRLPRLRGRGIEMSQQAGRIGTRGPGETQLEQDRRRIMRRIRALRSDLSALEQTRQTRRQSRMRSGIPRLSLVGYTNAGKSTLLNALTDAGVETENRLFSTLDPVTRRGKLPGGETVLLSDTVGFVRKLPHQLVEAFHSTLQEVNDADVLIHVVDGSGVDVSAQIAAVHAVLDEVDTDDIPELLVMNKMDAVASSDRKLLERAYPQACFASAKEHEGLSELLDRAASMLREARPLTVFAIPHDRGDVLARLHAAGEVVEKTVGEHVTRVVCRPDESTRGLLAEFVVDSE